MNSARGIKETLKSVLPKPAWEKGKKLYFSVKGRLGRPDIYDLRTSERIGVSYSAPSDMRIEDRLFLYAFIRGIKPVRALEAGIFRGGSALVIASAMEDNGMGRLVGIDPTPDVDMDRRAFFGRFEMIREPSPDAIPKAVEMLGGPLDFVLIDDIHIFSQVYSELKAVRPFMAEDGYILLHDAFNYGVHAATEKFLQETGDVRDCGLMSITPKLRDDPWTPYGGLRLLRTTPGESYVMRRIEECYLAEGLEQPRSAPDIFDHDTWYCRAIRPCERCRATRPGG